MFLGSLLAGQAQGQIFVTTPGSGTIGKYDTTSGATINASLVSGLNRPSGIALFGGHLFVLNSGSGTIGEYDATTGATINSSLISNLGSNFLIGGGIAVSGGHLFVLNGISIGVFDASTGATVNANLVPPEALPGDVFSIAVSGGHLFVAGGSYGSNSATIGVYDATTGATINASLVGEFVLSNPFGIAISGGHLFVANLYDGTVGEYDATTGATINSSLVPGDIAPVGIAVSGGNLFVTNYFGGTSGFIGEYNATTGATINASLVSGLNGPFGIAVGESYSAQLQQPVNPDGSSVFSVKRGVVPVKFTVTASGAATCQLPPATISLIRTAGTVLGAVDESTYLSQADNGSTFRIEGCQYGYNLATSSLGTGTYKANISIGGVVVGSGTFSLK